MIFRKLTYQCIISNCNFSNLLTHAVLLIVDMIILVVSVFSFCLIVFECVMFEILRSVIGLSFFITSYFVFVRY